MTEEAPNPEEAIPKSFIRKKMLELVNIGETADEKVRVLEALSKLEGYIGPGSQASKRDDLKKRVQIVTTSKYKVEKPKVPAGLRKAPRTPAEPEPGSEPGPPA